MVTNAYRLANIREVHLLNYKLIETMPNRDESMVTVLCIFAEVNHDYVPIVVDDSIQPFDMRPRLGYKAYKLVTKVQFLVEFEEIEDFIAELKLQLTVAHVNSCDLYVS